jgi:ATP-dependent Lon protease
MNFNLLPDIQEILLSQITNEGSDLMDANNSTINDNKSDELNENKLSILALRNTVLFPGVIIPISVSRPKSLQLIREVYHGNKLIGTVSQIDPTVQEPGIADLNKIGTVGLLVKILEMPDQSTTVLIQGKERFIIKNILTEDPYMIAQTIHIPDDIPDEKDFEFEALVSSIKETAIRMIQLSQHVPQEAVTAIKNIENPVFLINYICSNTDISSKDKQVLLENDSVKSRGRKLLDFLNIEIQKLQLKTDIQTKVKTEIDQQQREYFLNQQMKTIQNELGGNQVDQDIKELIEKGKEKKWDPEIKQRFEKEIEKLRRINPISPDFANHINYIQTLVDLPWNEYTIDNFDLVRAKNILDEDHFGLDKIKDRILEHLAVLKLKGDLKAPILCLFGPPGVGKTSLGKSIAKALDRKYIRMSLGGLHDEAEIRGHRKTYIGAMPGRIIQNLLKAKSSNPVFILDEIDKVGSDFRGDPAYALLEVLDPEQNSTFYDNYLELEFNLSKVLFIATANSLGPIKPALRDRMEIIYISGYILEEKVDIAKHHLIPKQLTDHGVNAEHVIFSDLILEYIIDNYTRESGVRDLDKKIAQVIRNIAKKIGFNEAYDIELREENICEILGQPIYQSDKYQGNEFAGVVTGLAWTPAGGEILFVETSLSKGKNNKLTLTGNLGNVMRESAVIALEYIKSHAKELKISEKTFENWNVHMHIPEGAIPKDGPSAGLAMATALASVFTKRKVRENIAMTGEITLRGKILPVGGIKEKILAAKRANIKEIILSKENEKDILEIKEIYIKGLKFHYFDTIIDAINFTLLKKVVKLNTDSQEGKDV